MARVARVSGWLFLIVVANPFAQNLSTPTETEVCTAEDYAISAVALSDLLEKQKPDRVLLRDRTLARSQTADPAHKVFLRDVPEEAKINFDSRNKIHAKIEGEKFKTLVRVMLLSAEEEEKLAKGGGGCDVKAPITFVSLPGLNAEHNRALIYVGTSCYDREHSFFMLLGKGSGEWSVLSRLIESSTTIDYFPPKSGSLSQVEPKIVSVRKSDAGNQYLLNVSFVVPDVPNYTFDTIKVYGTRIIEKQRSDDKNYLFLHGHWEPNAPAEFSVLVPKEFTDPSKGWILAFCIGSTASCYPSSNLLKLISRNDE